MIYVVVVQEVILNRSEVWVMSPCIGSTLGSFRHRLACRLMGRQPRRVLYGTLVYPPMAEAMVEVGLQGVYTYFA